MALHLRSGGAKHAVRGEGLPVPAQSLLDAVNGPQHGLHRHGCREHRLGANEGHGRIDRLRRPDRVRCLAHEALDLEAAHRALCIAAHGVAEALDLHDAIQELLGIGLEDSPVHLRLRAGGGAEVRLAVSSGVELGPPFVAAGVVRRRDPAHTVGMNAPVRGLPPAPQVAGRIRVQKHAAAHSPQAGHRDLGAQAQPLGDLLRRLEVRAFR
mmetsp:Transcript_89117/g.230000  ORF Transcript_89117/g.230000 Transcript_89117/m.230000 type:complete len:211 (+) Transcript_89117:721-1353(+)